MKVTTSILKFFLVTLFGWGLPLHGDENPKIASIAKLLNPTSREKEARRLFNVLHSPTKQLVAFDFFKLRGSDEKEWFALFTKEPDFGFQLSESYSQSTESTLFNLPSRPGDLQPKLRCYNDWYLDVFDSEGKKFDLGIYKSNGDYIYDFNGDGEIDHARFIQLDSPNSIYLLEIVPFRNTILKRPTTAPLFRAKVGENKQLSVPGYRCLDRDGDGLVEIEFFDFETGEIYRFTWNKDQAAYQPDKNSEIPKSIRIITEQKTIAPSHFISSQNTPYEIHKARNKENGQRGIQLPYQFKTLSGKSQTEVYRFFNGTPNYPSPFEGKSHLPPDFWNLAPKEAALKLAEANRDQKHQLTFELKIDHSGPDFPDSGWATLEGHQGCVTFISQSIVIRYGVDDPFCLIGGMNRINLSKKEAEMAAALPFWLDRIRSHQVAANGNENGFGSTADGFGGYELFEGKDNVIFFDEQIWAGASIENRWHENYHREVALNLANFAILQKFIAKISSRKPIDPEWTILQGLRENEASPIPPKILAFYVRAAGNLELKSTLPYLNQIKNTINGPSQIESDFQTAETRYNQSNAEKRKRNLESTGDPFDPFDAPKSEAENTLSNYMELQDKVRFLPYHNLSTPVNHAIRQIEGVSDKDELWKLKEDPDLYSWALSRLKSADPKGYFEYRASRFLNSSYRDEKEDILQSLKELNRDHLQNFTTSFPVKELRNFTIEIAELEACLDFEAYEKRLPGLIHFLNDRSVSIYKRNAGIQLLGNKPSSRHSPMVFDFLMEELQTPQKDEIPRWSTQSTAFEALVKLQGKSIDWALAEKHLPSLDTWGPGELFIKLSESFPNTKISPLIKARLEGENGPLNSILASILILDLWEFTPLLQTIASEGPSFADGPGNASDFSLKTQKFHIAREILALWKEPDPETRARMWTTFAFSHLHYFTNEYTGISPKTKEVLLRNTGSLNLASREKLLNELIKISGRDSAEYETFRKLLREAFRE